MVANSLVEFRAKYATRTEVFRVQNAANTIVLCAIDIVRGTKVLLGFVAEMVHMPDCLDARLIQRDSLYRVAQ